MRSPLFGAIVAAAVVGAAGFWSSAAEASPAKDSSGASIVVRTYTQADSAGAIRTARRTVSAILGRAGIDVVWLECGLPDEVSEASDACQQSLRWSELVVRILPAGTATVPGRHHLDMLGFAFVDLKVGGGSLATVYSDRVELIARSAGVDPAELLGRAMAHEIGHLLLGTNRHAPRGLMRASWSTTDLRRSLATEWLFGGSEGDVMRRAIASRVEARAPERVRRFEGQHAGAPLRRHEAADGR